MNTEEYGTPACQISQPEKTGWIEPKDKEYSPTHIPRVNGPKLAWVGTYGAIVTQNEILLRVKKDCGGAI